MNIRTIAAVRIHGNASGSGRLVPGMTLAAALAITLAACSGSSSTAAKATGTQRATGTPVASAAALSTSPPAGSSPTAASSSSTAAKATGTQRATGTVVASAAAHSTSAPAGSSPQAASSGLSGNWSGHYSGSIHGDFTVNLRQSGSALSGTITLAADGLSLPIHGTVKRRSVRFGTGSTGITCYGTVSGHFMSGTYHIIDKGTTFSGPWAASKSSRAARP